MRTQAVHRRVVEVLLVLGFVASSIILAARWRKGGPGVVPGRGAPEPVPAAEDGARRAGSVNALPAIKLATPPRPPKRAPATIPAPDPR